MSTKQNSGLVFFPRILVNEFLQGLMRTSLTRTSNMDCAEQVLGSIRDGCVLQQQGLLSSDSNRRKLWPAQHHHFPPESRYVQVSNVSSLRVRASDCSCVKSP